MLKYLFFSGVRIRYFLLEIATFLASRKPRRGRHSTSKTGTGNTYITHTRRTMPEANIFCYNLLTDKRNTNIQTADLTISKIVLNSIVSIHQVASAQLWIWTTLSLYAPHEFLRIRVTYLPPQVMEHDHSAQLIHDGHVYKRSYHYSSMNLVSTSPRARLSNNKSHSSMPLKKNSYALQINSFTWATSTKSVRASSKSAPCHSFPRAKTKSAGRWLVAGRRILNCPRAWFSSNTGR